MAGRLWTLASKEARELIRERVVLFGLIVGPILVFAVMGGVAGAAAKSAAEQARRALSFQLVWTGPGEPPEDLEGFVAALVKAGASSVEVAREPGGGGEFVRVYIGPSELKALEYGKPVVLRVEIGLGQASVAYLDIARRVDVILDNAARIYTSGGCKLCLPGLAEDYFVNPVDEEVTVYYRGRSGSLQEMAGLLLGVSIGVPVATMILVFAAMTVAAVSVGVEKEAKTLEMLLTLPVSRRQLIAGKALGVMLLTLAGMASYGLGLYIYGRMLQSAAGGEAPGFTLRFQLGAGEALIVVAALAVAMYIAIIIGFAAGALAGDVRGAQLLASYIGLVLAAPAFALMFGLSPESLPGAARLIVQLDPFMALVYTAYYAVIGEAARTAASLGILVLEAILLTAGVAKLVESETMVTGASRLQKLFERVRGG